MWRYHKLIRKIQVWRLKRRYGGGHKCHYCRCVFKGERNRQRTVDHRVPKSRGGSDRLANLVLACAACNRKKADMTESEFWSLSWLSQRRQEVAWEAIRADREERLRSVG